MKTFSTIKNTPKFYDDSYYQSDQASDYQIHMHNRAKQRKGRRYTAYSMGSSLDYSEDYDYDDTVIWDNFGDW